MTVAIVAHDAGGAELLSSYVRRNRLEHVLALDGPARVVFSSKLGRVDNRSIDDAIDAAAWVLCGTSWQSDLEWTAIRKAKAAGKRVVAFVDHWANYRERFVRNGIEAWPDEVWVGDEYGLEIARETLPGITVTRIENPYLLDLEQDIEAAKAKLTRQQRPSGARILFVCEPVSEHARLRFNNERHWGYTEFDAVLYLLAHIGGVAGAIEEIRFRPHPAELSGKYDWVTRETRHRVAISCGRPLVDDIVQSDVVAGCNSMAMVVGLVAGKRVICCIPPDGPRCALPHREVEHLRELVGARH